MLQNYFLRGNVVRKFYSEHWTIILTHLPILWEDRQAESHGDGQDEDGVEDCQHDQDLPETLLY